MTKGVIGCDEIPFLGTCLNQRQGADFCQRVGVIHPHHVAWFAVLTRNATCTRTRHHRHLVFFCGDIHYRQSDRAITQLGHHVHAIAIQPFARTRSAHIGLVQVIGRHHLDWLTQHLAAKIFNGQLGGQYRAWSDVAGIGARHIR